MAEKGDLANDTVSLPPTYAPSETFTDSPPPAYKRPGMAAVRIARIVCFTLLAMTFIVGFFVITHKWVQTRECNCAEEISSPLQHAALFAQVPSESVNDLNNNQIEENIVNKVAEVTSFLEAENQEQELTAQEQIIESPETEEVEEEKKDFENILTEEAEEVAKNIELPKNLLLGNPNLAGRNVHCKVEKRQRKIAEGIMTQAIIVTCDDDSDDEDNSQESSEGPQSPLPHPLLPIQPPMSLLSTIMKVLSARPRNMENRPMDEPRRIPFPFPGRPQQGPIPMIRRIRGPLPGPFNGPFNGPVSPIFVPLRNIERRPMGPIEDEESRPTAFFRRFPPQQEEQRDPRQGRMLPPMRFLQRPQQEQEEEEEEEESNNFQGLPFPFRNGPLPFRVIRLPSREGPMNEEAPQQEMHEEGPTQGPFPLPIHPLAQFLPTRRRVIRLMPKPSSDNSNEDMPFPFPRGALPMPNPHFEQPMPHPVPEASGRALPSPVALPGVRVVHLPFRPQPQVFPEAKLITHMEVRQPQEQSPQMSDQPPNAIENQSFRNTNKEFGPPKIHTVLKNAPRPLFGDEEERDHHEQPFHQEPITQNQSQPRFLAPPPPRYAREGRTSIFAQLNPDAEIIPTNEDTPESTTIHRIVLN